MFLLAVILKTTLVQAADTTPPTKATVDIPTIYSYYKATAMPASFSGKAKDNTGGDGLNANSATFYIKKSDNTYWTGSAWSPTVTWLPTIHDATRGDIEITWTSSVTMPAWTDGTYYVKSKATDKAGYSFEGDEIYFVYDATPPTTNIDSPPSPLASTWIIKDFTLQYDITDTKLLGACKISTKDNGKSWAQKSTACGDNQQLTITVGNGKWCATEGIDMCNVEVYGKDKATNENKVTRSFSIDLTKPTIDSLSHSPKIIIPDTDVTIKAEASDSLSGISYIKIYVDNQLKQPICTSSPCLNTGKYIAGTYSYYVVATDKAGNEQTSATGSFTVIIPDIIPVKKGWNIISVPFTKFEFASSTCETGRNFYNYDSATKTWNIIKNINDLKGGKGYWAYSGKACEIKIIGLKDVLSNDIKNFVVNGWNQIGSPKSSADFSSIKCSGGNIDTILEYDTSAINWKIITDPTANFEKYKGYFIKASGCTA